MLDYQPMTEEEIDKLGLLEGKFKFRVIQADDTFSKSSGVPQIELKLRVEDGSGNPSVIKTYLSTNGQFMLRRLRHFCRATGLMAEYEARKMCASVCLGVDGVVELGIEKGQPMPDGSGRNFADKTTVVDFIERDSSDFKAKKKDEFNDDIPF